MLDKFLPAASFPAVPVLSCYAVIAPTDHRDTAIQAIGAAARFTVTEHQSLILAVAAKEIIGKRYYIVQQLLLAVLQFLQIQILLCNVRYLFFRIVLLKKSFHIFLAELLHYHRIRSKIRRKKTTQHILQILTMLLSAQQRCDRNLLKRS